MEVLLSIDLSGHAAEKPPVWLCRNCLTVGKKETGSECCLSPHFWRCSQREFFSQSISGHDQLRATISSVPDFCSNLGNAFRAVLPEPSLPLLRLNGAALSWGAGSGRKKQAGVENSVSKVI
jgi:hypothetical protein